MSQRRANKGTVNGHLRHSGTDVVAMFATIVRNPGRKNFLQSRQRSRREHLRTERVCLQLFEISLSRMGCQAGFPFWAEVVLTAK